MTNYRCAVCGHVNRVGVAVCEMCDTRLGAGAGPRAEGETSGASYGPAGEGFAHEAGPDIPRDGSLPTDIPSPQFKGAGDVISPTLEVYRKHFLLVGLLVLVTTLPIVLLHYSVYTTVVSGSFDGESGGISAAAGGFSGVGGGLLYWALTLLGNALLSGALAYAVVQIQRRGSASTGESLVWGLRKLPKVVGVTLVGYLIAYGLPALAGVLVLAVLGPVGLIVILLLLLPWLVLVLTFSLAVPAAAIENRGVFESLARSAELTKGHKGLLFLTYFLWWIVILLLTLLMTWSFAHGGAGGSASSLLVQLFLQMLVTGMLNSSMLVLTVYIFLGVLNEHRQGFGTHAYTAGPEAPAR